MAKFDSKLLGKYGFLGGRPKSFKSPKDMLQKMGEFLQACEARVRMVPDKNDGVKAICAPAPVTLEDFCVFSGITKTTFYKYAADPKYRELCANFKQVVEAYWVRQCAEGNSGNKADFILKNAFSDDWKDSKDVALTGEVMVMPTVKVDGQELEINIGDAVANDDDTGAANS
jgi:hypothetical protein